MKRHILWLLFVFSSIKFCLGISYDLTKSLNLWLGKERAIFLINKFSFLAQQLPGSQGFYSSNFPLKVDQEFELSFNIKVDGQMVDRKDGFLLGILDQKTQKFMNQKYNENQTVDYKIINQPGFYLWMQGDQKAIQFSFIQEKSQNPSIISCKISSFVEPIKVYIQQQQQQIKVYLQQTQDQQMQLCGSQGIQKSFKEIYLNLAAKSQRKTQLGFQVTQMFFNTQEINPDIDQYNSYQNEDISRLFQGIYLNEENQQEEKVDLNKKEDILDLLTHERSIEKNLKFSLQYLKNSLTSAQELKDFFDYHKSLRKEQKLNTMQEIDQFLDLSKNTTLGDQAELSKFEQDERSWGLYDASVKIKQNIKELSNFYYDKQQLFSQIKSAHFQIQQNLKTLHEWNLNHQNFAESLSNMQNSMKYVHNFKANKALAKVIAGFGFFVVFILGLILHWLSNSPQVNLKI